MAFPCASVSTMFSWFPMASCTFPVITWRFASNSEKRDDYHATGIQPPTNQLSKGHWSRGIKWNNDNTNKGWKHNIKIYHDYSRALNCCLNPSMFLCLQRTWMIIRIILIMLNIKTSKFLQSYLWKTFVACRCLWEWKTLGHRVMRSWWAWCILFYTMNLVVFTIDEKKLTQHSRKRGHVYVVGLVKTIGWDLLINVCRQKAV